MPRSGMRSRAKDLGNRFRHPGGRNARQRAGHLLFFGSPWPPVPARASCYNAPMDSGPSRSAPKRSKEPPPGETLMEAAYLKALGEKQQPVAIKLVDGEVLHGWIEYYDQKMVRLTREGAPNLFIFKHNIAYIAEV